jgi:hypothetical protein
MNRYSINVTFHSTEIWLLISYSLCTHWTDKHTAAETICLLRATCFFFTLITRIITFLRHVQKLLITLGNNAMYSAESQLTFRRSISPPSSGSKNKPSHLLPRWYLARFILRPWRWKRNVPPKHRLAFKRTARRYMPEGSTLHNHCCENLKSYIIITQSTV